MGYEESCGLISTLPLGVVLGSAPITCGFCVRDSKG